ncbi:hypothetical protein ES677_01750 [Bizionia gelidisalsuginis]|uniref:Arginyl-tRNA synthetase n=1 Tax=Bizionia gelidisalsuginis TaxID=291188 RepID=A0ABY3MEW2_9FLAO|nr:hypothetical protein [Bizionia gelidisalsuginis]TYC18128.1 hypothetical protein ES677_01750 [Bizionia gelidisalsuginis]
MLFNTTYKNKDNLKTIDKMVGNSYGFLERIKLKGTGSKRMIIEEVSPNLRPIINRVSDINYASIELRSKGILIYITKGLSNFTWVIPFYQLVIYKTNGTSIHAQGKYIHFKNNITFKENKRFFDKLLSEKLKFDEKYKFQHIDP